MKKKEILMVGYGAMGSALGGVWEKTHSITVIDPLHPKALSYPDKMASSYQPDMIVLAVKPQLLSDIVPLYKELFSNNSTIWISIAAGVSLEFFAHFLKGETVVRAMPNLAVRFQQGITALFSKTGSIPIVKDLFQLTGQALWLEEESQMDAVTAIAGSGPAYFYALVEALASAGQSLGLNVDKSMVLARQTAIGAGCILHHLSDSVSTLCQQVTSPHGTTAAALQVLMDSSQGLTPLIQQTVKTAYQRAIELGQEQLKLTSSLS